MWQWPTSCGHLQVVFPGAVRLFQEIDGQISLRFLARVPAAARASWLSEKRLGASLVANGYSGRKTPGELYRRLIDAPRGAQGTRGMSVEPWFWLTSDLVEPVSKCPSELLGLG